MDSVCWTINKQNDIYMVFRIIEELEPKEIVDIGMFFKRVGMISRNVMEKTIPDDIELVGVDIFRQWDMPVWKNIYNRIYSVEKYLEVCKSEAKSTTVHSVENSSVQKIALIMGAGELAKEYAEISQIDISSEGGIDRAYEGIWDMLEPDISHILMDREYGQWVAGTGRATVLDIKLDEDIYYLV